METVQNENNLQEEQKDEQQQQQNLLKDIEKLNIYNGKNNNLEVDQNQEQSNNEMNNTQSESKPKQKKKKPKQEPPKIVLPSFKILVLHGFQQYYERIEEKIQPWIKFFSKNYQIRDVLLPVAPNKTLPNDPEDPFRCWLALNKDDPLDFDGRWVLTEAHYHFYDESEEHLLEVVEKNPDIDIIINFSQGSLMGSLFYAKNRDKNIFKNLKMIINICGVGLPKVINENLKFVNELYEEKEQIEVPTLFLVGEKDQVVPFDRTQALMKWYKNKQTLKFDGPHCIPKQKIYLEQVKKFIDETYQAHIQKQNEKLQE
ncbi:hypothetical protein ABPG72_005547 [Tetrahymena utriculariae]